MKSPVWQFGPFVLHPSEHVLLRSGQTVRLARKDFDLLVLLVERAGQLVRKEELIEKLWPQAFVEEGNLTKHVSILRKALGDLDGAPIIETVPKVGFRFVAPVSPVAELAARRPPARILSGRTIGALTIAGMAVLGIAIARPWHRASATAWKALAVLPFTPLDGQKEPVEHLGLGLADGIITRLSSQRLLAVRPTSVVRGFAHDQSLDPKTIAQKLGADVLLQGHVQRDGNNVRITVQLLDASRAAPIWGDTFDQPAAELFKLEDAIASRVARELRLQIGAAEQQRLRRRYTENAAAYDAYLAGREALLRYTPDGTRAAVDAFRRALSLDPSYALARAGLAMASADMYLRFASADEVQRWGEEAEREAASALAADPDLAEAHAARAAVLRKREFDWAQVIDESRQALTLNPNMDQPHLLSAAAFYHLGLMDRASSELDAARRAGTADQVEALRIEALTALFSGDFGSARARLEDVSRRSSRAIGDVYLALTYFYTGEVDRSRALLEASAGERSAATATRAAGALAGVRAAAHDTPGARRAIEAVLRSSYRDHHVAYSLGAAYAQLGDARESLRWLRSAAESGFPCRIWYTRDPLLDPLRDDKGFGGFLIELAQAHDTMAARYRD